MKAATFASESVPAVVASLRAREAELKPYLDGVDDFINALGKRNDKSKIDIKTLHLIAKEKSRRRAELVWRNDPKVVEQITELAFSIEDDTKEGAAQSGKKLTLTFSLKFLNDCGLFITSTPKDSARSRM